MTFDHRVAVVGLGYAGEQHVRCFTGSDNAQVVAVVDTDIDRAHLVAERYGVATAHVDYRDVVTRPDVDMVSVCTPNFLHAPVVTMALEAGKHVLCIKPLARSEAEVRAMVSAASAAGTVLEVAYSHRSRSDVRILKSIVDSGGLGRVYYARAQWRRRDGIPVGADNWFHSKALAGGGPLIDLGVHLLDLLLFLLGEPDVLAVSASTSGELMRRRGVHRPADDMVEDLGVVMLRLADGATMGIEAGWAMHGADEDDLRLNLYGSLGGAEIDSRQYGWQGTLRVFAEGAGGEPTESRPDTHDVDRHAATVRDFIRSVESGGVRQAHHIAALTRARIIDACYESAARGAEVTIQPVAC